MLTKLKAMSRSYRGIMYAWLLCAAGGAGFGLYYDGRFTEATTHGIMFFGLVVLMLTDEVL